MIANKQTQKTDKYILDDNGNPVPEPDLMAWGRWMQTGDRTVKNTQVANVRVSTVFLGLDHNYGTGTPLLFETMCFPGESGEELDGDGFFDRYATREEAAEGHERIVERVRKGPNRKDER